jgi:hypothetical protein
LRTGDLLAGFTLGTRRNLWRPIRSHTLAPAKAFGVSRSDSHKKRKADEPSRRPLEFYGKSLSNRHCPAKEVSAEMRPNLSCLRALRTLAAADSANKNRPARKSPALRLVRCERIPLRKVAHLAQ